MKQRANKGDGENCYIYMLTFTDKKEIYIGSTIMPTLRGADHVKTYFPEVRKGKKMAYKELIENYSHKMQMTILDKINKLDRYYWERFYMQLFKSWNFPLLNKQYYE